MTAQAVKTRFYLWEGHDLKGNRRAGELNASSTALVKAQLRREGITTSKIHRKKTDTLREGKTTALDINLFTRQLATLIKSGVPLLQAFNVIAAGLTKPPMRQLVQALAHDIASGTSLANALRKKPQAFDELYCNLVETGEHSGALELLLERLATHKEKTEALKKKIKQAMTYPVAVLLTALLVSGILLVKVVPQFQGIFEAFDAQLPAFTLAVIGLSQHAQDHGLWMLGGVLLGALAFRHRYKHSQPMRQRLDRWLLRLPVAGKLLQANAIAHFARTLSTTFTAGVPLLDALDCVAGASGNSVFKQATWHIKQEVATGNQIHRAMKTAGVFPSMAIQMTAIGEESGALDDMLDHIATYYENEVDHQVDSLTTLLEPMLMAVLGIVVGGLVIAMYLPIFKLGQVI